MNTKQIRSDQLSAGKEALDRQTKLNLTFMRNVERFTRQGHSRMRAEALAREAESLYISNMPQA